MDPAPLTAVALEAVRRWFQTESRDYPWTATEDPYAIWISEVMLQQTVVTAAVVPYQKWMTRWPTVAALATASEDEVLRAWEGLGYASRAKNLHRATRVLADRGATNLPSSADELRALPGVGEYTAAAVLSFAFHQPALTLDANLKRVFQRLDAAPDWSPALEARWRALWAELITGPTSRASNQGVMQLGQRVCRAKNPACDACPLAEGCRARIGGLTASIPAPKERLVVAKATDVVFWHRDGLWWLARPVAGRFSNLWLAPPVVPGPSWDEASPRRLSPRVHSYTKYRDALTPWVAAWNLAGDPPVPEGWVGRWATAAEAEELGMVSVYRKIFDDARA
jgi:A/G-specific adenine glycosylase